MFNSSNQILQVHRVDQTLLPAQVDSFVGCSLHCALHPPALNLELERERTKEEKEREVLHLFRCYTHTHTPSLTHHLSHTTLSHTVFHTQLCHTLSFTQNFHPHHLSPHHPSHTTLSHTIFHHTILHTHNFVTHHLSPHHLSHTTLSHTIFHTQLCHTLSFTHNFHTHHLSHTALSHTHTPPFFVTHHLSHSTLSLTTVLTSRSFTASFPLPSFPVPATTFHAYYWKKLTCGVIRSFNCIQGVAPTLDLLPFTLGQVVVGHGHALGCSLQPRPSGSLDGGGSLCLKASCKFPFHFHWQDAFFQSSRKLHKVGGCDHLGAIHFGLQGSQHFWKCNSEDLFLMAIRSMSLSSFVRSSTSQVAMTAFAAGKLQALPPFGHKAGSKKNVTKVT